jgi:outer membrane lipoprotein-sorting protein
MQGNQLFFPKAYFPAVTIALAALAASGFGPPPESAAAAKAASAAVSAPTAASAPAERVFTPLGEADKSALLARLKQESGQVKGIRSKFVQTSQTAMLVKPEVSRGVLSFAKPMAFRYEYDNGNVFTLKEGSFTYYLPAQKQAGRLDLRRYNRLLGKFADPLGVIDHIGTDFILLEAGRQGEIYRLKLAPAGSQKRGPLAGVTLELAGTPLAISAISVAMKNGDSLGLAFSATELNPALPDSVFSVKIPGGVTVNESLPSNMNF